MKIFNFIFISVVLLPLFCSCSTSAISNRQQEQEELTLLKAEIEEMVADIFCSNGADCGFLAFGSKPCGGPWRYLIYNTAIDTVKLKNLVENYNQKEQDFNIKYNIISDCMYVLPPTRVDCVNGICTAIY